MVIRRCLRGEDGGVYDAGAGAKSILGEPRANQSKGKYQRDCFARSFWICFVNLATSSCKSATLRSSARNSIMEMLLEGLTSCTEEAEGMAKMGGDDGTCSVLSLSGVIPGASSGSCGTTESVDRFALFIAMGEIETVEMATLEIVFILRLHSGSTRAFLAACRHQSCIHRQQSRAAYIKAHLGHIIFVLMPVFSRKKY